MILINKSSKRFFILFLIFLSVPVLAQFPDTNTNAANDYDLSSLISDYRIVFLGETNHGVSEQYSTISTLLEKMFSKREFELLQSESSFFKTYAELLRKDKPSLQSISMIYKDSKEFSPFMDFAQSKGLLHAGFDPQVIVSAEDTNAIVSQFRLSLQQTEIFQ